MMFCYSLLLMACFWPLLGRSRPHLAPLGRSWAPLGRSWGACGRSWTALGRSWAALGPLLVRAWAPLGCSWGALGRSFAALRPLLAALGRSWAALGPLLAALGRSWAALGLLLAVLGRLGAKCGPWAGSGPPSLGPRSGNLHPGIQKDPNSRGPRTPYLDIGRYMWRFPIDGLFISEAWQKLSKAEEKLSKTHIS